MFMNHLNQLKDLRHEAESQMGVAQQSSAPAGAQLAPQSQFDSVPSQPLGDLFSQTPSNNNLFDMNGTPEVNVQGGDGNFDILSELSVDSVGSMSVLNLELFSKLVDSVFNDPISDPTPNEMPSVMSSAMPSVAQSSMPSMFMNEVAPTSKKQNSMQCETTYPSTH